MFTVLVQTYKNISGGGGLWTPIIPPKYSLGFYPSTVTSVTNSNIYSLPGVHFALFQQSRKSHHSPKISILLRCPARLKPEKFSKSKPEPGPNPTRKSRAQLTSIGWWLVQWVSELALRASCCRPSSILAWNCKTGSADLSAYHLANFKRSILAGIQKVSGTRRSKHMLV